MLEFQVWCLSVRASQKSELDVPFSNYYRYLNWNKHIHELSKKLSRANGILSKLRYNASLDTCLMVYYAIFFSHLTYGCNLWGLTSEENISKIEVLQKKCVRIMTFAPFNSHTNEIFINLKLLKVRDLISLSQLRLVYDFLNDRLPSNLMTLFRLSSNVHTTSLQLKSAAHRLIYIPDFNSITYGKDSLRYQCAKLWNSKFKSGFINVDADQSNNVKLEEITTVTKFKISMKKHFLYSYSVDPVVIYY